MYARNYLVNPMNSTSLVISGRDAITEIEQYYGTTVWSADQDGANLYTLLNESGAKALYVEVTGAPAYVLVPIQNNTFGLSNAAIFPLERMSCDDTALRVGEQVGNWCVCLMGCEGRCPSCPNDSDTYGPCENDGLQFQKTSVGQEPALWSGCS